MAFALCCAEAGRQRFAALQRGADISGPRLAFPTLPRGKLQIGLSATGKFKIYLRKKLGIDFRAVMGAHGQINVEPAA